MTSIVARITGRTVLREDDAVPVPAIKRSGPDSRRRRDARRRSVTAAIMGVHEDIKADGIIPSDAEEIEHASMGTSGIKIDTRNSKGEMVVTGHDSEQGDAEPGQQDDLISPKSALVAPDLTPHALEPLDPLLVPKPPQAAAPPAPAVPAAPSVPPNVNPLDVLLGRTPAAPSNEPELKANRPVTVEAAQASVNASLGISSGPGVAQGSPMPEHKEGTGRPIMEAFYRFGAVRNTWASGAH